MVSFEERFNQLFFNLLNPSSVRCVCGYLQKWKIWTFISQWLTWAWPKTTRSGRRCEVKTNTWQQSTKRLSPTRSSGLVGETQNRATHIQNGRLSLARRKVAWSLSPVKSLRLGMLGETKNQNKKLKHYETRQKGLQNNSGPMLSML